MNVVEALEKISKALGILATQTAIENRAGMYSKNVLAETLLLPVFQILVKAPDLKSLNDTSPTAPFLDLYSKEKKLGIQVTTETTAQKITDTVMGVIKGRPGRKQLVIFLLTTSKPHYKTATKKQWKRLCGKRIRFDPDRSIFAIDGLYASIKLAKEQEIRAIEDVISRSIVGERFIDVEKCLKTLSHRQLDYEKETGKYIPDVFVEKRETKNLARTFAHPALFLRRTLEALVRADNPLRNALLSKAGLPLLTFPPIPQTPQRSLDDTYAVASNLPNQFVELRDILKKYRELTFKDPPPFPVKPERLYYYKESIWPLECLGIFLGYRLDDLMRELSAVSSRILIITGKAGQGKTNLVCDFTENFLLKHGIPSAYISPRMLRSMATADLGDAIQRLLFDNRARSFQEAAELLSQHARLANKPFILIIDGINEHSRISNFAEKLEFVLESAMLYPHIKVLLTCRSEFFQQRFGKLIDGPLKKHVLLLESNDFRVEREFQDELVAGYFSFFKVESSHVSEVVREILKKDTLLLRFFCEAYGAKGKSQGYVQPYIPNIQREDIFEKYLDRKIGAASELWKAATGKTNDSDAKTELREVLVSCIKHMLDNNQYANVPVSAIPVTLSEPLEALLEEELILRRDLAENQSIFSSPDERLNFTFDEFRDFMISHYLVHRVYAKDPKEFERYIQTATPKESQVIEGVKRFLFYAARNGANTKFLEFYESQPWYTSVYSDEVFFVDPRLLTKTDSDKVLECLQSGGSSARSMVTNLAVRWSARVCPHLNLDLLLGFVAQCSDSQFDDIIRPSFRSSWESDDGASAKAFCKFLATSILPKRAPNRRLPEHPLYRLLVILMPVDATPDLNSDAFRLLREIFESNVTYVEDLLWQALDYKMSVHRPYVWRLLSCNQSELADDDPLVKRALAEKSTSTENAVLQQEVSRFLQRRCSNIARENT